MKVVSLFAGIGGFDLGFMRAGFKIVAHVEKDANCRKLLAAKWPDAIALDDVCTAGAHNLPACDVITFGFPCQDLSVAGKRAGLKGKRSGLFYEATRIINELRPSFCLFENVPGLLSSEQGRDFLNVLLEMDRIGYNGAWRVLDAQWFGVAQRRRRCFGLFSRLDSGAERCAKILSITESLRGHPAPRRETGEGIAGGVAPCLAASGRGTERTGETRGQDCVIPVVAGCLAHNGKAAGSATQQDAESNMLVPVVAPLTSNPYGDHERRESLLVPVAFERRFVRTTGGQPNDTGVHPCLRADANSGDGAPCVAFGGDVARTLVARHDSSPCADRGMDVVSCGMQVRRLTPKECERLQGFPDGWTEGFSDSARYRMLGNAVAVPVAKWIATRLAKSITSRIEETPI